MLNEIGTLFVERWDFFAGLLWEHLVISLIAILIAVVIGGIAGILISEFQKAAKPTLGVINFLYTIPSISMLGFLIPFSGVGNVTAVIALTVYALLPMVRNTHTGITNLDPAVLEAAKGMGSTRMQILFKIKLPLAMPVIMSGIRSMVTMTIALAGIASFIGAGGLGVAIYRGITTNNAAMTVSGSILIAVLALLINNVYMVPILGIGFSLAPIWYLRSTAASYKKHLNEELETAISIITTSYLRTEDLIRAVKENLPYINEPVKANFEAFVYEAELINANLTSAINSLKMKVPNRVFHEWCNILIQCQSDRSMKNTLPTIAQKFSDVRVVQSELEAMMQGPRREAITMMFLVIANVPLLYFLNEDWVHTLIFTTPGNIALAICAAIILFALTQIMKLSKPIEYGGDGA